MTQIENSLLDTKKINTTKPKKKKTHHFSCDSTNPITTVLQHLRPLLVLELEYVGGEKSLWIDQQTPQFHWFLGQLMLMRARQTAFTPAKMIFHRGRAFLRDRILILMRPRTQFATVWLDGMRNRVLSLHYAVNLQFETVEFMG